MPATAEEAAAVWAPCSRTSHPPRNRGKEKGQMDEQRVPDPDQMGDQQLRHCLIDLFPILLMYGCAELCGMVYIS